MTTPAPSETAVPDKVETAAEQAFRVHAFASQAAEQFRARGEELAKIIYKIRTVQIGGRYVWEWMGHEDERSYFAAPLEANGLDLGFRMVDRYFGIHRDVHVICGIPSAMTKGVDRDKLDVARKLLVKDGERVATDDQITEVLSAAKALSRSDFRDWVNEQAGIPPKVRSVAATDTNQYDSPLDLNNDEKVAAGGALWFAMLKGAKCCLKPWKDGVRAHVPVSKGAGRKEWEHCVLPINQEEAHTTQHQEGMETWIGKKENHRGLFRYLYRCLFVLLEENRELKEKLDDRDRS